MNLKAYARDLREPTRYRGYLATINQLSHQAVGGGAAAVYMDWGLGRTDALAAALIVVPMLYFVAWEIPRMTALGQLPDALTDTAFVCLGGVLSVLIGPLWIAYAIAAAALYGIRTAR